MTGMLRRTLLAAALGAAIALAPSSASAERFTSILDDLEGALTERGDALALVEAPTRPEKREMKACTKALAILAGGSVDLLGETKIASKAGAVAGKAFPADEEIGDVLEAAADELRNEVADRLNQLDEDVAAKPASKGRTKAEKAIAAADALLQQANAETDPVAKLKLLWKALKKAGKAQKFLDGATGGGGGGGGAGCFFGSRTLTAGESCIASGSGGPFTAAAVKVELPGDTSGPFFHFSFRQCSASGDDPGFILFFMQGLSVSTPYEYSNTSGAAIVSYSVTDTGDFTQTHSGSGTVTFTTYDPVGGTFAGTFSFLQPSLEMEVTGSFHVTNAK